MKVTLDTNVLVSATFWRGDSNTIMEKVEKKEVELILSNEIIEEFKNVLGYKDVKDRIRDKNLEMMRTIEKVVSISKFVDPIEKLDIIGEDKEDNKILECAKAGKVDYIVTKEYVHSIFKILDGVVEGAASP